MLATRALPLGGRLATTGGANAAAKIVELIGEFAVKGAKIIATRDYHPHDHVSFLGCSPTGFPPHCIQGSEGSKFYAPIKTALELARSKSETSSKVRKSRARSRCRLSATWSVSVSMRSMV